MTAKVFLNPYSNRWNAKARWPEAEAALKAVGVAFEVAISEHKGHITDLVAQAVKEKYSPIIVAGGDGSIGDAVNGLVKAAGSLNKPLGPLGILPMGSANDLADHLRIPRDLRAAAAVIATGKTSRIDLCKCNDRYFVNNSAAGLEPYVTVKQERIRWLKGISRYLLAAVLAILDRPEWHGEVDWDGGSYKGPLSLVSVGNGPRSGGLFYMAPHADLRDGKLTFAYGYRKSRLGMLQALPRAMKPGAGSYVEMDGMYEIFCTRLSIHLDKPSPAHTDGELFPAWIRDFEYEIYPQKLELILP
jgi:diacylglycerol kinase (ATP)